MIRRVLLWLAVVLPLALGVVIGFVVRLAALWWAALVRGYYVGRGL